MERLRKTLLCFPLFAWPHKAQTFEREVGHHGSLLLLLLLRAISPLLSLTSDCEMAVMSSRLVCFFCSPPPHPPHFELLNTTQVRLLWMHLLILSRNTRKQCRKKRSRTVLLQVLLLLPQSKGTDVSLTGNSEGAQG